MKCIRDQTVVKSLQVAPGHLAWFGLVRVCVVDPWASGSSASGLRGTGSSGLRDTRASGERRASAGWGDTGTSGRRVAAVVVGVVMMVLVGLGGVGGRGVVLETNGGHGNSGRGHGHGKQSCEDGECLHGEAGRKK